MTVYWKRQVDTLIITTMLSRISTRSRGSPRPNKAASFAFGSASGCLVNKNIFQRIVTAEAERRMPQGDPCLFALIIKSSSTIKTLVCCWGKCTEKFFHLHCVQMKQHEACLSLSQRLLVDQMKQGWGTPHIALFAHSVDGKTCRYTCLSSKRVFLLLNSIDRTGMDHLEACVILPQCVTIHWEIFLFPKQPEAEPNANEAASVR